MVGDDDSNGELEVKEGEEVYLLDIDIDVCGDEAEDEGDSCPGARCAYGFRLDGEEVRKGC
jgi:hypothetical protein